MKEFTPRRNYTTVNIATRVSQNYVARINMKRLKFIPKRKHTNVNIAARFSQHQVRRLYMKGFIPRRNHTNVNIAARASQHQMARLDMKEFIPKRNRTNVNSVANVSHIYVTVAHMRGFIPKRNRTNVNYVANVSHIQAPFVHMKGFMPKRNRNKCKQLHDEVRHITTCSENNVIIMSIITLAYSRGCINPKLLSSPSNVCLKYKHENIIMCYLKQIVQSPCTYPLESVRPRICVCCAIRIWRPRPLNID